jgi:hypothetical protein
MLKAKTTKAKHAPGDLVTLANGQTARLLTPVHPGHSEGPWYAGLDEGFMSLRVTIYVIMGENGRAQQIEWKEAWDWKRPK